MRFFFEAFPDKSHISQNSLRNYLQTSNGNLSGSQTDSEESNLSYFNMIYFFKVFPDISNITTLFKKIILQ